MKKTQKKSGRVSAFIPKMSAIGAFVVIFFAILVSVSYTVSVVREREHDSGLEARVQALESRLTASTLSNSGTR